MSRNRNRFNTVPPAGTTSTAPTGATPAGTNPTGTTSTGGVNFAGPNTGATTPPLDPLQECRNLLASTQAECNRLKTELTTEFEAKLAERDAKIESLNGEKEELQTKLEEANAKYEELKAKYEEGPNPTDFEKANPKPRKYAAYYVVTLKNGDTIKSKDPGGATVAANTLEPDEDHEEIQRYFWIDPQSGLASERALTREQMINLGIIS